MNIHYAAGQSVPTPRGHKVSKAGTKPPRTRNNATYPGGKVMRKALARLNDRTNGAQSGKRPDRIREGNGNAVAWGRLNGFTKPGSMIH